MIPACLDAFDAAVPARTCGTYAGEQRLLDIETGETFRIPIHCTRALGHEGCHVMADVTTVDERGRPGIAAFEWIQALH